MKNKNKSSFNSFNVKMNQYSFHSTLVIMIWVVLSLVVLVVGFVWAVYIIAPHIDGLWNTTTVNVCNENK